MKKNKKLPGMNGKGLAGHSTRNQFALAALARKGGAMKDRRAERGGSKVTIARREWD